MPNPLILRTQDHEFPWRAIDANGMEFDCKTMATARVAAGMPPIPPVSFPVPETWFRDFLKATGLTTGKVAKLLHHHSDRSEKYWKNGSDTPPFGVCELLSAWADGRAPIL